MSKKPEAPQNPEAQASDATTEFPDIADAETPDLRQPVPPEPETEVAITYTAPNVDIAKSPFTPRDPADKRKPLSLHRLPDNEITKSLSNRQRTDPTMSEDGRLWVDALSMANRHRVTKNVFLDELNSPDAHWQQFVEHDGVKLNAITHGFKPNNGKGPKLSGTPAIMLVRSLLGGGEQRSIPLFASGIWLTLKPDADAALSDLETKILLEKEHIGRVTGGLVLSNTSVYIIRHVYDFIIKNTIECNLVDNDTNALKSLIKASDIQNLVLGMASAMYPKGYPLVQPCSVNPSTCNYNEETMLNLRFMTVHDQNKLTLSQRRHMADRTTKRTVKEILDYQAQGPTLESEIVKLANGSLSLAFHTPSMSQYIDDGYAWINGITEVVDEMLGTEDDENLRRTLIEDRARLVTLRQYGHYVKHLVYTDDEGVTKVIDDVDTVRSNIDDLSSSEEAVDAIMLGIRRHIDRAAVTVVGTPKTKCPRCQPVATEEETSHPQIIPVDALQLFFTLLSLRLEKRQSTSLTEI